MKRFSFSAVISLLLLLWVGSAACATEVNGNNIDDIANEMHLNVAAVLAVDTSLSTPHTKQKLPAAPSKFSGEHAHHEKGLLPERERTSHPSYFLHPQQQAEYALVFALAEHRYIPAAIYEINGPEPLPWYICDTRPNNGFIDNCKPANLLFKGRINYAA
ncbi:hypothetical protein [Pseudoalteromonas piscicida]|uniref:hypothetical protein n=1 Tax=Pseudoalteromonas piscicida TaxID=43662 RepID=UPI0030AA3BC7